MKKKLLTLLLLSICFCVGCSGPSDRRNTHTGGYRNTNRQNHSSKIETTAGSSVVKMQKENGVYKVPIKINGYDMNFIFDTGASSITLSSVEAAFLIKQGALSEEDIIDEVEYQIADGSVITGILINLRKVQIANKIIYNVQASIVDNISAPLLLGQSALAQFGKVVIDYDNNTIEFK